jgi:uncharacterized membrane protein YjgN (DUF898 family)
MDLTAEQLGQVTEQEVSRTREALRFHGKAGEYFRIWIVNLSLTILTLGVYSAWAKVRKNRYIYGNLELAGSHFDYMASPLRILRGRLIAIVLLVAYIAAEGFMPLLGGGLLMLLTVLTPWLVVRSRMFNMRYTVYRNIRFGFEPAYNDAYAVILGFGILSVISLGMLFPYAHYRRNRMIVDNTRFGNLRFRLSTSAGQFYLAYLLAGVLAGMLLLPLPYIFDADLLNISPDDALPKYFYVLPFVLLGLFYYVVGQFVRVYTLRLVTNNTAIGNDAAGGKLGCTWSLAGMLGIYLTNIIAILLSLGLLIPWAQMRLLRYQVNNTWLDVPAGLDHVVAGVDRDISSLGEEVGDVFDVDIGL